jgi:GDP-L-fucose synthase
VVLWGDGHQKRELVFVDDFVNLMTRLSAQKNNDLINIGAGAEFSIRHFAQLICKEVGYDFEKIEFDPSRYVGAKSKCLEISKLKKIVPDLAYTPLEQGLSQTIAWFMKEKDKLL